MKEYFENIDNEIFKVIRLTDDKAKDKGWLLIEKPVEGVYYENCDVGRVKNIGMGKTRQKLHDLGIIHIKDVKEKLEILKQNFTPYINSLLITASSNARAGSFLAKQTDYRKHSNPYKARYGDEWESKIRLKFSSLVPVSDLVEYMIQQCNRVMLGTRFEGHGIFYHDALKQLCCEETVKWMKEKNYYQRWITPVLSCNDIVGEKCKTIRRSSSW